NSLIAVAVVLALIMVAVRVYRDIVVADDWSVADALNILQFVLILLIASSHLPRLPAADRDHDRDHVVARRRADHDHRLRQYPGAGAPDPLAHAASPCRSGDARPVLGGAILRPAADRNGGPVRSARATTVRPARCVPAAVRDVPATRRRRPPAAVRYPHRQMVLPAPLPGATAGDRHRTDPGSGGADVRARVARAAHPLDADRLGLAVQSTLAVRTRRRAPRRRGATRRGHRAMAAQRPIGQRAAAAANPDRRAALGSRVETACLALRDGAHGLSQGADRRAGTQGTAQGHRSRLSRQA